jgi:hypothetical protein
MTTASGVIIAEVERLSAEYESLSSLLVGLREVVLLCICSDQESILVAMTLPFDNWDELSYKDNVEVSSIDVKPVFSSANRSVLRVTDSVESGIGQSTPEGTSVVCTDFVEDMN